MKLNLSQAFRTAVLTCDEAQLDAAFAILKYREIGILRKAKCFALIFKIDEAELVNSLPKAADGRILDKPSRNAICDLLIERASDGEEG